MLRILRYAAFALIAALLVFWGVLWFRGDSRHLAQSTGLSLPGGVAVGGPFALTDTLGKTVTDQDFRGRWMLVYFGYTFCPDVCPTELQTVADALKQLGPQAEKVAPLFITVDPERDTVAVLAGYVKLFDDRLLGLTGTPEQIAAITRAYRVYYAKANAKDSNAYLMDHSSFLYLMGPDGKLQALFKPDTSGKDIAEAIRQRIAAS